MNAAGYRFIRLRDVKLSVMDDPCVGFDATITKTHIDALLEKAGASRDTIDFNVARSDYQNQAGFQKAGTVRRRPRRHRSLAFLAPEIAREWDYRENAPLLPSAFSAQSNLKAFKDWNFEKNDIDPWNIAPGVEREGPLEMLIMWP